MKEGMLFQGDYCYLVEHDMELSEFSLMETEIFVSGNVQETVIKYGAKIVTCYLMN